MTKYNYFLPWEIDGESDSIYFLIMDARGFVVGKVYSQETAEYICECVNNNYK